MHVWNDTLASKSQIKSMYKLGSTEHGIHVKRVCVSGTIKRDIDPSIRSRSHRSELPFRWIATINRKATVLTVEDKENELMDGAMEK